MAIEALSIPTNLYPTSYSGMGEGWQNFSQNQAMPILSSLLSNYPGYIDNTYNTASTGLANFTSNQLQPAIQSTLNGLAGRNMINSSVAGDALSKTLTGLAGNMQGYQANLAADAAKAKMAYPSFALNAANTGQHSTSTNPLAPYQMMADLIARMM